MSTVLTQLEAAPLEAILDTVQEGVIIVERDGTSPDMTVVYLNPVARRLADFVSDHSQHRHIDALLPLTDEAGEATMVWPIEDILERHVTYSNIANYCIKSTNGDLKSVAYSIAPISTGADETVTAAMITIRDIQEEKELMRLKSEFVSVVSHQLRTPASAAKWNLETLLDNRHGNEQNDWQREKLQQSYQSNERMISLINDLLNVSRLDDGQMNIELATTELAALVDPVVKELHQFALANNVEIISEIPDTGMMVDIDISKVREVIVNLLTNAIKYTQRGHHQVTIIAKLDDAEHISNGMNGVVCSVVDQGIGIPKESIKHLFKKFYRADNAVESQTEGSGLGLYIARQIVRLHGGDLWVDSELGKGTTVSFVLPLVTTSK